MPRTRDSAFLRLFTLPFNREAIWMHEMTKNVQNFCQLESWFFFKVDGIVRNEAHWDRKGDKQVQ